MQCIGYNAQQRALRCERTGLPKSQSISRCSSTLHHATYCAYSKLCFYNIFLKYRTYGEPSLKVEQTSQEGRVFSEDDRRAKENERERGMRGGRRWRTNSDERMQLSAITRREKINCHAHDRRHCV